MGPLEARHWPDLLETLDRCARRVPLYRGIEPPASAADAAAACREALPRFPVLTRERLRGAFPHGLVPDGVDLATALRNEDVSFEGTSGTTDERVQILWSQPWWDAQERDGFRIHPLPAGLLDLPGYREAVLTTPVCTGNLCHVGRLPMAERTIDGRLLFLNQDADPSLWSDDEVRRMADEIDAFRPEALEGSAPYLAHFAVRLLKLGRRPWRPRFVDVSYEFPSRLHVAAIRRAFDGVPVLDAYGSTECGFVFMECERGRHHQNVAWHHVEVLPVAPRPGLEGLGLLVVTPLRNEWLNLVRYETGDLVRAAVEPCPCGRTDGLSLESIEGRTSDLLVGEDGRVVTPRAVDRALVDVGGLLHYRLRQRGPRDFALDLVPTGLEPLDAGRAAAALAPLLGVAPRVRAVPSVPVEASGKFRVCQALHLDARALLAGGAP